MENTSRSQVSHPPTDLPQLSCQLCRSRKIKCDKLQPCTACASAGAQCVSVHRLRLPRGRHVHHNGQQATILPRPPKPLDDDLRRRIRRLEALVSRASPSSVGSPRGETTASLSTASTSGVTNNKHHVVMQHPEHFWTNLTEEIHGLCDIVESSPEEAEDDTAQTPAEAATSLPHGGIRLLGLSSSPSFFDSSQSHTYILHDKSLAAQLCEIYLEQVDPIIKILHRPSVSKHLIQGEAYLNYPSGHTSVEVLDAAVLYSAVASMTDTQCTARIGRDRTALLGDTRRACEASLERSGLLTTRDMTVLQAFLLYLSGRQVEEQSRAVWTLMAVAVRVAKALSLNLEDNKVGKEMPSFFVQQMRRHLWMTICLMDVQAGFAMSSEPLLSVAEAHASYRLPRHINDAEYGTDTQIQDAPPDRPGLTDTTYALIKYRLQLFGRQAEFPSEFGSKSRQELADDFAQDMMTRAFICDPEQSTFAWLVFHSAQCFVAGARVAVLRRPKGQERACRGQGNPELVRAYAQVLEKTVLMHTDARGERYRWAMTVRWHGLAIALAECYLCAKEASPAVKSLLREVWPTMEAAYTHHEGIIARYRGGTLQGPLGKLMARTRQTVAALGIPVGSASSTPQSLSTANTVVPTENTSITDTQEGSWDTPDSWNACWDDLLTTAALDDDWAMLDTQFYDSSLKT